MSPDLAVAVGPVELKSPVICGSGEHAATEEDLVAALDAGAAAVVAKSANETEAGRRQWEVAERVVLADDWTQLPADAPAPRSASILNRSGLVPTPWPEWLDVLARADAHARARDAYVVASVIPGDPEALPDLAADVERAGLRWLELNLSAPHASEAAAGAIVRAAATDHAAALTKRVRGATALPITVKLTAESDDVLGLIRAVCEAGADAVALTGRHAAFLPDPATRRPVLGTFGAISGAWGLPLVCRHLAKARQALGPDVPLIATNGARDGLDVARFLLAGARAVQVASSVLLEGFGAIGRITAELAAYLDEQGVSVRELVGEAADHVLTYEEVAVRSRR